MARITPKLIDQVFDDSVLNALPANDEIKKGVAIAKHSERLRGKPLKEEHKQKIRNSHLDRFNDLSEEEKKALNKNHRGKVVSEKTRKKLRDSRLGKTHTITTKEKMSNNRRGRILTEDHKKKISDGNLGRIVSDETKRKISEANRGRVHKPHSEASRLIRSQKAKIKEELKRQLGLGNHDCVPKDLLEKAYLEKGLL